MKDLGLERRAKPAPDLTGYLAKNYGGKRSPQGLRSAVVAVTNPSVSDSPEAPPALTTPSRRRQRYAPGHYRVRHRPRSSSASTSQRRRKRFCGPSTPPARVRKAQLEIYRACTGRQDAPAAAFGEVTVIAGARAGDSRIAALIVVYEAVFGGHQAYLVKGDAPSD